MLNNLEFRIAFSVHSPGTLSPCFVDIRETFYPQPPANIHSTITGSLQELACSTHKGKEDEEDLDIYHTDTPNLKLPV